MKTPKFIEVTVLKFEMFHNHPNYSDPTFGGPSTSYDPPYRQTFNTSTIEDVFVEEAEDYLTAIDFNNSRVYVEESYKDVKRALGAYEVR